MKYRGKRLVALLSAIALGVSTALTAFPANAASAPSPGEVPTVRSVTDTSEIDALVQDHWDDSFFDQVVIDPRTETASVDGQAADLEDTLDLTPSEAEEVLSSPEAAESFFSDTVYDTQVTSEGDVVVTAPYQTMRIVLYSDTLTDSCGATQVLHYPEYREFVLQYPSQEAAQAAYEVLSAVYGVENCFPDELVTQDDLLMADTGTSSSLSWGARDTGMDRMKAAAPSVVGNNTATVAILDTGADTSNVLFRGHPISSASSYFKKSSDNSVVNSSDYSDILGHGTHVAGIIADCTPSSVSLMILRVFDEAGKSTNLVVNTALQTAISENADVINMSFGWTNPSDNVTKMLNPTFDAAFQANIPVCCSAGNNGIDVKNVYPASNDKTLAVSAVRIETDNRIQFASDYSNYGQKIDFAAPGSEIESAWIGGGKYTMSGTSMATPHLAAAAAYVKLRQPGATVEQVCNVLKRYAVDLGEAGRDDYFGWGYVNLAPYYGLPVTHNLPDMAVTLSTTSYVYDGQLKKPRVTLKENGKTVSAKQYTVTYKNNKLVGTGTVTVTGTGTYQGKLTRTFTIKGGSATLSTLSNSANGIKVTWKKTASASGYRVYRKAGKGDWKQVKSISSGDTLTWTDTAVSNGVLYYYRVRPVHYGKALGSWKNAKSIRRTGRTTLTSLSNTAKGIKVTWKKTPAAIGYRVHRKAGKGDWKQVKSIAKGGTLTWTDTAVTNGVLYHYRARPVHTGNTLGTWQNSKSLRRTGRTTLASLANTAKGIKVTWKKTPAAIGYRVHRKAGKGNWKQVKAIAKGGTLTWTDTAVSNGVVYYYRVRPVHTGKAFGTWKNTKSLRRTGRTTVSSLANTTKGIQVTWNRTTAASGYRVYRKADTGNWKQVKVIARGSALSWTDTSVSNGVSYRYRVRPVHIGNALGTWKNTKALFCLTPPKSMQITRNNLRTLLLTWQKNSRATGYQVQYDTSSGFRSGRMVTLNSEEINKLSVKALDKIIKRLKKTRYYVRVRSFRDSSGVRTHSAWSAVRSITLRK